MAGARSRYVWDPAGSDRELARACTDLRMGRWDAARLVLKESRGQYGLRATRSAVLATRTRQTDLAEQWLAEDPSNPDALLLLARTAVARALYERAYGDLDIAKGLGNLAVEACEAAAKAEQEDPTPFVALMSLSRLGYQRSQDPYGLGVEGPWRLWAQIAERDPLSREGHRRLLAAVSESHGGSHGAMWAVAGWAALHTPGDSDPQLLTLAALVEHYRARRETDPGAADQWHQRSAVTTIAHLYTQWFARVRTLEPPHVPVADLSLLAHALLATNRGMTPEAAHVLDAMLPCADPYPWDLFGEPAVLLDAAVRRVGLRPP